MYISNDPCLPIANRYRIARYHFPIAFFVLELKQNHIWDLLVMPLLYAPIPIMVALSGNKFAPTVNFLQPGLEHKYPTRLASISIVPFVKSSLFFPFKDKSKVINQPTEKTTY